MLRPTKAISCAALLCVLALVGCGSSSSTATNRIPKIAFTSPAITAKTIPVTYTCDGKDISPPLEWGAVPPNVSQLALFVLGFIPQPSTKTFKVSVEWALAGLNPALHRLPPGGVPPGAYVGLTTDKKQRYSICPAHGKTIEYAFELYGLPSAVTTYKNFQSVAVLNSLVDRGSATFTNAHGAFAATYKRQ